jgi:hypothetical protein
LAIGRPRGRVLAVGFVAALSLAMGGVTAAIAAGALIPSDSKGCRPDIEKCPSFVDWHAGLVPGLRVTGILLVVGLLVVAGVSYLMKPRDTPPTPPT